MKQIREVREVEFLRHRCIFEKQFLNSYHYTFKKVFLLLLWGTICRKIESDNDYQKNKERVRTEGFVEKRKIVLCN